MGSENLQAVWEALLKAEEEWQLYSQFGAPNAEMLESLRDVVVVRAVEFARAVKEQADNAQD
jgi:hypothetical protein